MNQRGILVPLQLIFLLIVFIKQLASRRYNSFALTSRSNEHTGKLDKK